MVKEKDWYFFDCDGVIVDSNKVKSDAFYRLALPYGISLADKFRQYHVDNGGVSRFEKVDYLLSLIGEDGNELLAQELVERFARLVKVGLASSAYVEGVLEFINSLPKNAQKFVVSGGFEPELHELFKARGIFDEFALICGSPRTKHEIIFEIVSCFGVDTNKAVFFGDSKLDYEVATEFSIDFIFIAKYSEFVGAKNYFVDKNIVFKNTFLELL